MSDQDAYWLPTGPHRPADQGTQRDSGAGAYDPDSRPDFALPSPAPSTHAFPPPSGVPPIQPRSVYSTQQFTAYPQNPAPTKRGLRGSTVVAVAALTALLVGGAAGVGANFAADLVPTTASPSPGPTPSGAGPSGTTPSGTGPSGTSSPAPTIAPAPPEANTVEIAAKLLPSTVTIRTRSGDRAGSGSGFVIDADNAYVMTNNHVVALGATGGEIAVEFNDGTGAEARIVGRSPSYDIAVIQIDTDDPLAAVEIGDAESVEVGQPAIAVGAPLGLGGTVTQGIISAKNRAVAVGAGSADPDANVAYIDALQTDAPINPGNSGGPLVDAGGRVIGVNSAILTIGSERGASGNIGLGFAIPINQAVEIGTELIRDGVATYPVLGAEMADVRAAGVQIGTVSSGGPAAKGGLKGDDVIVSIDGKPISTAVQLIVKIRTHRPGEVIELGYTRDGTAGVARITLGTKEG